MRNRTSQPVLPLRWKASPQLYRAVAAMRNRLPFFVPPPPPQLPSQLEAPKTRRFHTASSWSETEPQLRESSKGSFALFCSSPLPPFPCGSAQHVGRNAAVIQARMRVQICTENTAQNGQLQPEIPDHREYVAGQMGWCVRIQMVLFKHTV